MCLLVPYFQKQTAAVDSSQPVRHSVSDWFLLAYCVLLVIYFKPKHK